MKKAHGWGVGMLMLWGCVLPDSKGGSAPVPETDDSADTGGADERCVFEWTFFAEHDPLVAVCAVIETDRETQPDDITFEIPCDLTTDVEWGPLDDPLEAPAWDVFWDQETHSGYISEFAYSPWICDEGEGNGTWKVSFEPAEETVCGDYALGSTNYVVMTSSGELGLLTDREIYCPYLNLFPW